MTVVQQEFAGRVALVTGGASGIGAALVRLLAERGAAVAVADRDTTGAQRVASEIEASGGIAHAVQMDVTDFDGVGRAIDQLIQWRGRLDLAANCAGAASRRIPLGEMSLEEWRRMVGINLDGAFHCSRHEIPAMLKSGGGAIVNFASILGLVGMQGTSAYTAAKHGVIGLTRAAALDYAQEGIRVNAVAPGYTDTAIFVGRTADQISTYGQLHPMGRMGTAEEIAQVALFLLSSRSTFVTGACFSADGGYVAR